MKRRNPLFAGLTAIFVFSTSAVSAEPQLLPWELLEEGWIQLFDGQTLYGWQPTGETKWEVNSSEIRTDGKRPGFLMTTTEWADYELQLEFRATATTNSGVFLRTAAAPKNPALDCYELNIAPIDNPFPTGSFVARQKTPLPADKAPTPDTWHTFRVVAWAGWITAELDGQRVADLADPSPVRIGHIGLQCNSGPVAFRNIRLRPIELWPFLATGDLSNFNTDRAEQSRFDVNDRELHVVNGPGQIETNQQFANFVLQLQCKVNGDGLNSGVFFRTIPSGRWVGYESQINNVFKNGDRAKPADFGTGGIYRRQPARRIVADDREWFTKTIVADGPHMAVWVNGYQVSDWTDARPQRENAREGLRFGPGAIAIQGHDPTTDLLFRNIRAAELPR
ncbi:MAG: DUF1080 domain-containing protein [Pirellulales bacterium]